MIKSMTIISVAKAIILDRDNHMLVLTRSSTHPTLAGHSDLPGGLIDKGEEPGRALVREISEETGLVVEFSDLKLVYSGTELHQESQSSYVRLLYIVKVDGSKPAIKLSFEHDASHWNPITELATIETEYIPFYAQAFKYLMKNQIIESIAT